MKRECVYVFSRANREAKRYLPSSAITKIRPRRSYFSFSYAGGRGGIRTLEGFYTLPVFKTGTFNHSVTLPNSDNYSTFLRFYRYKSHFVGFACRLTRYHRHPDSSSARLSQSLGCISYSRASGNYVVY